MNHVLSAGFRALLALLAVALAAGPADARKKRLDEPTAASGLKEALSSGTLQAVEVLGTVDGYLKNDLVRIDVPDGLKAVDKVMRALGHEALVDEFVTSMNRAAEAAAPLAKEVFLDSIRQMSFTDALRIVRGSKHEATDYLEETSTPRLKELFRPIISRKLDEVGATAAFDDLMARHATLPFVDRPLFDLDEHVTDGALDGMFLMIAKQEENIRTNVVARTTDLLKEVFGSREARKGSANADKKPWWNRL